MKYSMVSLTLLVSFAVSAMQEKEFCRACAMQKAREEEQEKPKVIKAVVGQMITLDMYTRDALSNIFYAPRVTPDESVLQFVKEFEENKGEYTTSKREYRALKKGTTHLKFGLHTAHLAKFLGFVAYTVVVE